MFLIIALLILILAANCLIFIDLYKANRKMNKYGTIASSKKAALTISVICWVFISSYLPVIVIMLLDAYSNVAIPLWLDIISQYAISLNVVLNPFIYGVTNKRFWKFVKGLFIAGQRTLVLNGGYSKVVLHRDVPTPTTKVRLDDVRSEEC